MGSSHSTQVSDVTITAGDGSKRLLVSVTTIFKDDSLFSYKITVPFKELFKAKEAQIDTISGKGSSGIVERKLVGGMEVTYHPDGMVMFKDRAENKNISKEKHRSIEKLGEPRIFFQMTGLLVDGLDPYSPTANHGVNNIPLPEYGQGSYLHCDFYIGSRKDQQELSLLSHSEHIFRDPVWFSMVDQRIPVVIYIFIYRDSGELGKVYFNIPSRSLINVLKRHITILVNHPGLALRDYLFDVVRWVRKSITKMQGK